MLKGTKSMNLSYSSIIDGKSVVYMSAQVPETGKSNCTKTIQDQEMYEANKAECRKDILYVSNTVNSHCSISVISLISEKIRKKQLAGEIQQPYQKIVTYETEKFSDLSIKEAYEYLKTLPEFEGAEDVFEDKNNSV